MPLFPSKSTCQTNISVLIVFQTKSIDAYRMAIVYVVYNPKIKNA